MKLFANLAQKMRAHKLIGILVICVAAGAVIAGCVYGWQQYQYRQTSEYTFLKIKEALSPPNPTKLAKMVDFNALTEDLAGALATNFPFFQPGPDQKRNIKRILQTALLKRFMEQEDPKAKKTDESEEDLLARDLEILPPDFLTQLTSTLNLNPTDRDKALVSARIENPQLQNPFTLVFSMRRAPDGFRIEHLVNANETASHLRNSMLVRHKAQREAYERKNAATTKQMNSILPIESCTANAGTLSDGKTTLMVVHVIARNRSDIQVNNMTVDTKIMTRGGQVLARRYLNAAQTAAPGSDFSHRWNFDLESGSDLARSLLAAGHLTCEATWRTLGLGNGKVLHIQDAPNPDRKCEKPGHNHPVGFCELPVFKQ